MFVHVLNPLVPDCPDTNETLAAPRILVSTSLCKKLC